MQLLDGWRADWLPRPPASAHLQAGDKEGRCGWRWCLRQLAASAAPAAPDAGGAAAAEEEGEGGGRDWDPAQLLRSVLNKVDVHK